MRPAKLVGDITYLPTWEGFAYLATVIDCHTKACIGYAIAEHMRAELVIDVLHMAARNYTLAEGAIFHSDRGTQYTCDAFAEATASPSESAAPSVEPASVTTTPSRNRSTLR